jgi:hypothetical protein
MMSWLLKDSEGCKLVASSVIMDPVSFLLCDPTVATNFVYREPRTPIQFMMHFSVSRELFIANTLSRHFAWSHNIMFVEDLLNSKSCCGNSIHDVTARDQHYSERCAFYNLFIFILLFLCVFFLNSGKLSHGSSPLTLTTKSDSSTGSSSSSSGSSGSCESESDGSVSGSWDKLSEADSSLSRRRSDKQVVGVGDKKHSHASHTTIEHTVRLREYYCVFMVCNLFLFFLQIFLSSEDSIVPVKEVARYLEQKRRD